MSNSNVSNRNIRFTTVALLVSLELVLGFTPLGFIAIPPVSITTMHIPVIITALILGPSEGAIVGLTFGLISLFKASTGASASVTGLLFSPFASGAPLYSIIMCLIPRVLLGIIPAYVNRLLSKFIKATPLSAAISAGVASICHTIMVLGCMVIFFNAFAFKEILITILSLNGSVEILAAVVVVPAIALPVKKYVISRGNLIAS